MPQILTCTRHGGGRLRQPRLQFLHLRLQQPHRLLRPPRAPALGQFRQPDQRAAEQEGDRHGAQHRQRQRQLQRVVGGPEAAGGPAAVLDSANSTSSSSSGRAISRRMRPPPGELATSSASAGARGRLAAIDPLAQFLAGLEERHRLLVHRHRLAGARVAPGPGVAPLHREGAEAAQLHPLAARQRAGDLIEDRRHDQLDIGAPQMRVAGGKFRDEFRFGHAVPEQPRCRVQPPERCQTNLRAVKDNSLGKQAFPELSRTSSRGSPESARLAKPLVDDVLDRQIGRNALLLRQPEPGVVLAADRVDQARASAPAARYRPAHRPVRAPARHPCAGRSRPCRRTGRTCP